MSTVLGVMVAGETMMLVMDVLIKFDVVAWAAVSILIVVFMVVFMVVFGCAVFAIDKATVLIEEIKFKFRKNQ